MTEFGIFTDEGMIEGGFWTREEARQIARERFPEENCWVATVCHDHEGQEAENCEECNKDDE